MKDVTPEDIAHILESALTRGFVGKVTHTKTATGSKQLNLRLASGVGFNITITKDRYAKRA